MASGVLSRVASLVRYLTDRVYKYGALDVKDRVRAEVLGLAREHMKEGDKAVIEKMPTHAEIANRVSTHREAVTRELNELSRMVGDGHRAIMLYLVQRSDCRRMSLARDLDPAYGAAFDRAREAGVEVFCHGTEISVDQVAIGAELPFIG